MVRNRKVKSKTEFQHNTYTELISVLCSLTAIPEMVAYLLTPGKEICIHFWYCCKTAQNTNQFGVSIALFWISLCDS